MPLERHHKILIGSFSAIVIAFMIVSSSFMYLIYQKGNLNYNTLDKKLSDAQAEANSKISELAFGLQQTSSDLNQTSFLLNTQVGSLNRQLDVLKASVGDDFSGIIEEAVKSVVTIKTSAGFQGTGFIIGEEGYVVTNAHVLADSKGMLASQIIAITSNAVSHDAQFVGYDGTMDIALLKISGSYGALELGNSGNVDVGEKVIAIGNPLGLQFSATQGIVSAIHRPGSNGISAYIQTDAALNPGNSGGPLIDQNGEVVGINNFKIGSGENLGFALESNYIKSVINSISEEKLNQTLIQ